MNTTHRLSYPITDLAGLREQTPPTLAAESLIASLSAQIAKRGMDPLGSEQMRLLRSTNARDRREKKAMLADLRDRVGLVTATAKLD